MGLAKHFDEGQRDRDDYGTQHDAEDPEHLQAADTEKKISSSWSRARRPTRRGDRKLSIDPMTRIPHTTRMVALT